jgi:hypothetical protein
MTRHQNFDYPIVLTEGDYIISTVDDALNFYFSLPTQVRIEWHWTEAAKLLVSTFDENGGAFLERAEKQFRFALGRHVMKSERAAA